MAGSVEISPGNPTVSIGLPVFNGERYLPEALESLLGQTYSDFEVVISDNASGDRTEEISRAYAARDRRIQYYRMEANCGAAINFNRTFELTTGRYFKWMAHDDVLAPTYLERCIETLEEGDESVVLCFPERMIMSHDKEIMYRERARYWFETAPPFDGVSFWRLQFVPDRAIPTLVFGVARRAALRRTRLIGPFAFADLVLVSELRLLGNFRGVAEPLFFNRMHEETPDFYEVRRTAKGEAVWYDPRASSKYVFPAVRLLVERLRSVTRFEGTTSQKLLRLWWIVIAHLAMRLLTPMAQLAEEVQSLSWQCWTRWSVGLLRLSSKYYWGHRLWAFLHGVRHFDLHLVAAGLLPPSPKVHTKLMNFVTERLASRSDEYSERLLKDWEASPCNLRAQAASRALSRR